jgi:4-amino-4-deoxy-L-arabinose transferase-like glycosyltransferase
LFLLVWFGFGLVFLSAVPNKLPGYVLPLMPAAAALLGIALEEVRDARPLLLAATTASMAVTFIAPPLLAIFATGLPRFLGLIAWLAMALSYIPTLRFYRQSPGWSVALPAIASLYLFYTLNSAYQYLRGRGGQWKGRVQADAPGLQ